MKKIVPFFFGLLLLGCALIFSQSIHDVVQSVDNFTLLRITSENETALSGTLFSGDTAIFVEFGADSTLVAEFTRDSEKYTVETVSFKTYKGALGAFAVTDLPGSYPIDLAGSGRKSDRLIQFVKGYYIVSVLPARAENMTGAGELARSLVDRIRGTGITPDIYAALPQNILVKESGFYFMGSDVFMMRFPSKLAKVLNLDSATEGVAAKYLTDDGVVDLIKIRYGTPEQARDAVNTYLKSRADRPVILPRQSLQYYTIVEPDRSEVYITDYAEWVNLMPRSPQGEKGREFFEYVLRGGK